MCVIILYYLVSWCVCVSFTTWLLGMNRGGLKNNTPSFRGYSVPSCTPVRQEDKTRQDKTRQDKTRHDKTRQINTISFQHNKKCISHLTYIIEKRKSSDTTHKRENEDRAGGGWVLVSLVSLIALTLIALQATLSLGSEENVLVRMHQGGGRQSGRQTGHDVSFSALERHV